jgi:hypothetical protein
MNHESQLIFEEASMSVKVGGKPPKTRSWQVKSRHDKAHLGWVEWFPRLRQYCFVPRTGTAFGTDCLQLLSSFCERCNAEKPSRKPVKPLTPEQVQKTHMRRIHDLIRMMEEGRRAAAKSTDLYGRKVRKP